MESGRIPYAGRRNDPYQLAIWQMLRDQMKDDQDFYAGERARSAGTWDAVGNIGEMVAGSHRGFKDREQAEADRQMAREREEWQDALMLQGARRDEALAQLESSQGLNASEIEASGLATTVLPSDTSLRFNERIAEGDTVGVDTAGRSLRDFMGPLRPTDRGIRQMPPSVGMPTGAPLEYRMEIPSGVVDREGKTGPTQERFIQSFEKDADRIHVELQEERAYKAQLLADEREIAKLVRRQDQLNADADRAARSGEHEDVIRLQKERLRVDRDIRTLTANQNRLLSYPHQRAEVVSSLLRAADDIGRGEAPNYTADEAIGALHRFGANPQEIIRQTFNEAHGIHADKLGRAWLETEPGQESMDAWVLATSSRGSVEDYMLPLAQREAFLDQARREIPVDQFLTGTLGSPAIDTPAIDTSGAGDVVGDIWPNGVVEEQERQPGQSGGQYRREQMEATARESARSEWIPELKKIIKDLEPRVENIPDLGPVLEERRALLNDLEALVATGTLSEDLRRLVAPLLGEFSIKGVRNPIDSVIPQNPSLGELWGQFSR